jgi:ankyrin repeat protein
MWEVVRQGWEEGLRLMLRQRVCVEPELVELAITEGHLVVLEVLLQHVDTPAEFESCARLAAKMLSADALRVFGKCGVPLDGTYDPYADTLSHTVCRFTYISPGKVLECLHVLDDLHVPLTRRNDRDETPLHIALSRKNRGLSDKALEVATYLMGHGADGRAGDWRGFTPAHLAIENDYPCVLQFLVDAGLDLLTLVQNEEDHNLLGWATESEEMLRILLARPGMPVNVEGNSTLLHCAQFGTPAAARLLLDYANFRNTELSFLSDALLRNPRCGEMLELLCGEFDARVLCTEVLYACMSDLDECHNPVVLSSVCLEHVSARDSHDEFCTLAEVAAAHGQVRVLSSLVRDATPALSTAEMQSLVHMAMVNGQGEICSYLWSEDPGLEPDTNSMVTMYRNVPQGTMLAMLDLIERACSNWLGEGRTKSGYLRELSAAVLTTVVGRHLSAPTRTVLDWVDGAPIRHESAFRHSCENGYVESMEVLLLHPKFDVSLSTLQHAMRWAIDNDHPVVAELLLRHTAGFVVTPTTLKNALDAGSFGVVECLAPLTEWTPEGMKMMLERTADDPGMHAVMCAEQRKHRRRSLLQLRGLVDARRA